MDVDKVSRFIRRIIARHQTIFRHIGNQQTKILELAAFLGAKEHYQCSGYNTCIMNPGRNELVVKTSTRGHPSRYSYCEVCKNGKVFEIHMNLLVRSAHDDGIYCVDLAVTKKDAVPKEIRWKEKWLCLENKNLITFGETKKLVIYPMLLAQFLGIVHEIKPRFIGGKLPRNFLRDRHFFPALIALGHFSGNSEAIVQSYRIRKIKIAIVHNYDIRLAFIHGGENVSPFEPNFFEHKF